MSARVTCLDGLLVLKDEVVRVAVVAISQQAVERLRRRIEVEDEAIDDGLFGGFELFLGDFLRADALDFRVDGFEGLRRCWRIWCCC